MFSVLISNKINMMEIAHMNKSSLRSSIIFLRVSRGPETYKFESHCSHVFNPPSSFCFLSSLLHTDP